MPGTRVRAINGDESEYARAVQPNVTRQITPAVHEVPLSVTPPDVPLASCVVPNGISSRLSGVVRTTARSERTDVSDWGARDAHIGRFLPRGFHTQHRFGPVLRRRKDHARGLQGRLMPDHTGLRNLPYLEGRKPHRADRIPPVCYSGNGSCFGAVE